MPKSIPPNVVRSSLPSGSIRGLPACPEGVFEAAAACGPSPAAWRRWTRRRGAPARRPARRPRAARGPRRGGARQAPPGRRRSGARDRPRWAGGWAGRRLAPARRRPMPHARRRFRSSASATVDSPSRPPFEVPGDTRGGARPPPETNPKRTPNQSPTAWRRRRRRPAGGRASHVPVGLCHYAHLPDAWDVGGR